MTVEPQTQVQTQLLRGGSLAVVLHDNIVDSIDRIRNATGRVPGLATLTVGGNPAAAAYLRSIERTLRRVGIRHRHVTLPHDVNDESLEASLLDLSADPSANGVVVLMPLPPHLSGRIVNESLAPIKDVDGITPANAGRLHLGLPCLAPSTPLGGVALLDYYGFQLAGKRVCVVGRSNVVGAPLAALLLQRDATVTICHSKSHEIEELTRNADIVATAVGRAGWLTRKFVSPGAVVLDFGINVTESGIQGDASLDDLIGRVSAITPVPGGTGPITTLILARNTVEAAFAQLAGNMDSLADPVIEIEGLIHRDTTRVQA